MESCPFAPFLSPKSSSPFLRVLRKAAGPVADGEGRPHLSACSALGVTALPLPAWPELGVSAAGVKGGGGRRCWPAGEGKEAGALARLWPGEGARRAAPWLSRSQRWPWGPLCSLRPLPARTRTRGSLTPSSWQPASRQPQLRPRHCPPPCLVSPDTHPTQGSLCQKGECRVCMCCWADLRDHRSGSGKSACPVTCLWATLAPVPNLSALPSAALVRGSCRDVWGAVVHALRERETS